MRRRSRIGTVASKRGRSGPLVFVAVHHDYETASGLAVRERQDLVYRDAATPTATPPPSPSEKTAAPTANLDWVVETTPVRLFRFSALTFNGHRIYYDLPYARDEEGYDGRVVHGPLQATLLLNLADVLLMGKRPLSFEYRARPPVVAGGPMRVCARQDGDGVARCWTEESNGIRAMEAVARG